MYEILISDEQDVYEVDHQQLTEVAESVLNNEAVVGASVSVALVDSETMQSLNNQHLGHDYDTDVLSFLLECEGGSDKPDKARRGSGKTIEGEIIISVPMAQQTSARFQWGTQEELALYLVHGILHVLGYDDLTEDELVIMRKRERELLSLNGLDVEYDPESDPGSMRSLTGD